jgi:hypothetical protein
MHKRFMAAIVAIGAGLAFASTAGAATWDESTGSFSVLIGAGTAFNDNPETFRLTFEGVGDLTQGNVAEFNVVLPVTWMTSAEDQFGISTRHSAIEVPPSLRLQLLPNAVIRPYGDLGLGVVFTTHTAEVGDEWVFPQNERSVGWMTRSALGLQIGDPEGLMFVVEPFSAQTYRLQGGFARVGAMIGLGSRF